MKDLIKLNTWAKKAGMTYNGVLYHVLKGKIECVEIDGVKFIDQKKYPPEKGVK